MKSRILIAGVGNIFFGDDGFGCEVAQQMARNALSDQVDVIDFGIRSYDLAYALTEGFEAVILVDAMTRGEPSGTVAVIEPDLNRLNEFKNAVPDAHSLDPVSVLRLAQAFGSLPDKLLLVVCEPSVLESEGEIGLSEPVRCAVPHAVEEIQSIIRNLLSPETETNVCLEAV